jgi:hypothetical protein
LRRCRCPWRGRRRSTGNRAYRCCGFGLDDWGFCFSGFGDSAVEGVLSTSKERVQGSGFDPPKLVRMSFAILVHPPIVDGLSDLDRIDLVLDLVDTGSAHGRKHPLDILSAVHYDSKNRRTIPSPDNGGTKTGLLAQNIVPEPPHVPPT